VINILYEHHHNISDCLHVRWIRLIIEKSEELIRGLGERIIIEKGWGRIINKIKVIIGSRGRTKKERRTSKIN